MSLDPELPSYTFLQPESHEPAQRSERTYHLKNSKGVPWATLRVQNSAVSSTALPLFYTGQDVTGCVELNLVKKDKIRSISVSGRIITGASSTESFTFLERQVTIWSKSKLNPLPMHGVYAFPFSISLPESVTFPRSPAEPNTLQAFLLPQTFMERNIRAGVMYDLTLHFTRGMFRMDSHLSTKFLYMSNVKPAPPSVLRQRAYLEGTTFPGPDGDPEGWNVFDPVVIHGSTLNARAVAVTCTLALATPLCYTRGSVIPCTISVACPDRQALALLSAPKAIVLQLQRQVSYFIAATMQSDPQDVGWYDIVEDITGAVWWVPAGGSGEAQVRKLEGEIVLPPDLKSSSSISRFSVSYSIALFPFSSPAFAAADTKAVLVRPVEVVGLYGEGPHPKGFTPLGYLNETSMRAKRMREFRAAPQYQPWFQ